jgi:hypothetical protein
MIRLAHCPFPFIITIFTDIKRSFPSRSRRLFANGRWKKRLLATMPDGSVDNPGVIALLKRGRLASGLMV